MSVTVRLTGIAVLSTLLLTGCGGGGGGSKAASPSAKPSTAAGQSSSAASGSAPADVAAAASSALKAIGAVGSSIDVSKQCAAIPVADVQALLKAPPGDPVRYPLECAWKNTTLKVSLSPNDADKQSYNDLVSTQGHAIAGLGDVAQWFEPVAGGTAPDVNAHQGTLTCYVQAGDPMSTLTLPYTGNDPFFKITDADSLAYATKEAKLCADIFSVS